MTEPVQDRQTVSPFWESSQALPAGVTFHAVISQVDERSVVCEHFDPRWGWHPHPLVFAYSLTVLPAIPSDDAQSDKHRLPRDTDQVPYRFANPRGW